MTFWEKQDVDDVTQTGLSRGSDSSTEIAIGFSWWNLHKTLLWHIFSSSFKRYLSMCLHIFPPHGQKASPAVVKQKIWLGPVWAKQCVHFRLKVKNMAFHPLQNSMFHFTFYFSHFIPHLFFDIWVCTFDVQLSSSVGRLEKPEWRNSEFGIWNMEFIPR